MDSSATANAQSCVVLSSSHTLVTYEKQEKDAGDEDKDAVADDEELGKAREIERVETEFAVARGRRQAHAV